MNLALQMAFNAFLVLLGFFGACENRDHFLITLICIEVMLLGLNVLFLLLSVQFNDLVGSAYAFFMLTVAAAESAVGLAIVISYFKVKGDIILTNNFALKS
jgi:NADH:ubiquinone oxidoreductase subunit K